MGLWDTVRRALGLERTPSPRPWEPPAVTTAGRARLANLPAGHALFVRTRPHEGLHRVQIDEAMRTGDPHPAFAGLPVVCSDEDAAHLRGLALDHDGAGWLVTTSVVVNAAETPNRDGRLYLTDRALAESPLHLLRGQAELPFLARTLLDRDDVRGLLIRGHTLTIERTPGVPWPPIDRAVVAAVRAHLLGCGGTLKHPPPDPNEDPLLAAVREVLQQEVAPAIHRDGGDLELIDVRDGVAWVRLIGACRTCPAATVTLKQLVSTTLCRAFPGEIHEVRAIEHSDAQG
jgi:Fe-S cluster biogenesis protein NfuA